MPLQRLTAAIVLCTFSSGIALAQSPVSVPGNPPSVTAPVPGANSFTQGEAKSRIEARGFSSVADLKKDDQGIWWGSAMKDGKTVKVALDFQGNVFAD
jgi:hypothetical protein